MNRRKVAGLLAALAPWLVLAATAAAQSDDRVPLRNLPAGAKLARPIDCDFQGARLAEVLAFFRQKLDLAVVLDPDAAGLAQKPITLTLKNVPAGTALTLALKQVRLQYAISLGVVWVGDRAYTEAREPLYYRQYDVADL